MMGGGYPSCWILSTWCKSHDWRSYNWGPLSKVVNWFVDSLDKEAGFWDEAVLLQGLGVELKRWFEN